MGGGKLVQNFQTSRHMAKQQNLYTIIEGITMESQFVTSLANEALLWLLRMRSNHERVVHPFILWEKSQTSLYRNH
jgi:hypothetical protein